MTYLFIQRGQLLRTRLGPSRCLHAEEWLTGESHKNSPILPQESLTQLPITRNEDIVLVQIDRVDQIVEEGL